jgi:hypothetical protein
MKPPAPYFRTSLRAFRDTWSGGPGLPCFFARFGRWARLEALSAPTPSAAPAYNLLTVLALETPYSVLPFTPISMT